MSNKEETIKALQQIVTGLAGNSFQHRIQSKIFASQGFTKLGEKYAQHAAEEMNFVEQFIDRILDLGGKVEQQPQESQPIYEDVLEFIKADYQVSVNGIKLLNGMMESGIFDITTYDLMKEYLKDEEEDMYWSEEQIELAEKIGLQNFLYTFL
ncbi:MAG: hypothetical protein IJJ47_06280 [Methanosphaera sp.]|nr:hypothetical protein [Methanosphaera sp.]